MVNRINMIFLNLFILSSSNKLKNHQRLTNGNAAALLFTLYPAVISSPSEDIRKILVLTKGMIWRWIKSKR